MVYIAYTMERKQIYLAEDQVDELNRLAEERHVPTSSLIRDAIAQYLEKVEQPQLRIAEEHPLWGIVGLEKSDEAPADGSVRHDEVVDKPRRRRSSK